MRRRKPLEAYAGGPVYAAFAPFAHDGYDVAAFDGREVIDVKCQLSPITLDPESQRTWRNLSGAHNPLREHNAVALDGQANIATCFTDCLNARRWRAGLVGRGREDRTDHELVACGLQRLP